MVLANWTAHAKECNWTTVLHRTQNLTHWLKDMSVRAETINLLEENIGDKLCDISLGNDFLYLTPKAKATKAKNKQVGLHQSEKLCKAKKISNEMKRQSMEWEKIF